MTVPPLMVEHLTKTFGSGRGITDVSLTVDAGQVFGFLGSNGAGKSTTIRCLMGLYRPTCGRAWVFGRDPAADDARFLRDVGYLPGELHLPGALSGTDILARFGRVRQLRDTAYRDQLVTRLGAELDRPVRALSKGNKQKLGIVLAFMHRPRLLILDEPTSGLDPVLQDEFATLLRETVADGGTVLLSSHDLDEVQRVVHRVAIIRRGRIVINDTIDALRASVPRRMELTFDRDIDRELGWRFDHDSDHDDAGSRLFGLPSVKLSWDTPRHLTITYTGSVAPVLSAAAALQPTTLAARPADLDELFRRLYESDPGGHDHAR